MNKQYCIFNPTRFQILDVEYGTKQEMEAMLAKIKLSHPHEDLVVMEMGV